MLKRAYSETDSSINPSLFTVFWYLSLQSLIVPESHYKEEIKSINEQLAKAKLDDKKTVKEIERLTNNTTKLTKAM